MDQYQQFIHKSRYARWIPEAGRRESWHETVKAGSCEAGRVAGNGQKGEER